jgi:hypothetical protein
MAYARIQNDTVVEILQQVPGFTVQQCFHPNILAMCEVVDDNAQVGWVRQEDGSFAAPAVEETPAAE